MNRSHLEASGRGLGRTGPCAGQTAELRLRLAVAGEATEPRCRGRRRIEQVESTSAGGKPLEAKEPKFKD